MENDVTDARESIHIGLATSLMGPLLNDEATVRAFAALILKRLHGEAELAKQDPLRVTDEGVDWLVMGSYQEPRRLPETGAWLLRVRKSDCRVEKFGFYEPLDIPDEIKSFFLRTKP